MSITEMSGSCPKCGELLVTGHEVHTCHKPKCLHHDVWADTGRCLSCGEIIKTADRLPGEPA